MPTAIISVPRLESQSDITGPHIHAEHTTDASTGTGAAFVTGPTAPPRKRLLPALVAGTAVLALVGVILIALSVATSRQPGPARARCPGADPTVAGRARAGAPATKARSRRRVARQRECDERRTPAWLRGVGGRRRERFEQADAKPSPRGRRPRRAEAQQGPAAPAGSAKPKGREDYGF